MDLRAFLLGCAGGVVATAAATGARARRTARITGAPAPGSPVGSRDVAPPDAPALAAPAGSEDVTPPAAPALAAPAAPESPVSPHFLNNALAAIASYVTIEPARAEVLLADLGAFLRYALEPARRDVTLAEELDFVEVYGRIEHARFGDRVDVRVTAEPRAREAIIAAGTVQAAVQRTLERVRSASADATRISVRAAERDGRIEVEVEASGPHGGRDVLALAATGAVA